MLAALAARATSTWPRPTSRIGRRRRRRRRRVQSVRVLCGRGDDAARQLRRHELHLRLGVRLGLQSADGRTSRFRSSRASTSSQTACTSARRRAAGAAPASGTGPTLIIEAGNTLAFNAADYILINRGSTIRAEGTANGPITFTGFEDAVARTAGPFDCSSGPASSSTATGSRTTATTRSARPANAMFSARASLRVTAATTTPRAPASCATSSSSTPAST